MGDFNFMFGQLSQLVESFPDTEDVTGSNPVLTTESRNNGKPPLPYGSQSVNLVKWGKIVRWQLGVTAASGAVSRSL